MAYSSSHRLLHVPHTVVCILVESIHVKVEQIPFFNPFPNMFWFIRVCSKRLLKTLWEKEKLLVTSNFSFSRNVSYLLENFTPFSSNSKLSSANPFSLEESKNYCLGEGSLPSR